MKFSKEQFDLLSKYLSDISKILIASTVIGFFIPAGQGVVTFPVFAMGSISAIVCLVFSLQLTRNAL